MPHSEAGRHKKWLDSSTNDGEVIAVCHVGDTKLHYHEANTVLSILTLTGIAKEN